MFARSASATQARRSLRLLVVEDNAVNQSVTSAFLSHLGHKVVIAPNGEQGIKEALTGDFDVILMDVQMPGVDGFQATAAIRKLAESSKARIPIVAMTAHAMRGDRERCLAAGMDTYISKPLDVTDCCAPLRWAGALTVVVAITPP